MMRAYTPNNTQIRFRRPRSNNFTNLFGMSAGSLLKTLQTLANFPVNGYSSTGGVKEKRTP